MTVHTQKRECVCGGEAFPCPTYLPLALEAFVLGVRGVITQGESGIWQKYPKTHSCWFFPLWPPPFILTGLKLFLDFFLAIFISSFLLIFPVIFLVICSRPAVVRLLLFHLECVNVCCFSFYLRHFPLISILPSDTFFSDLTFSAAPISCFVCFLFCFCSSATSSEHVLKMPWP